MAVFVKLSGHLSCEGVQQYRSPRFLFGNRTLVFETVTEVTGGVGATGPVIVGHFVTLGGDLDRKCASSGQHRKWSFLRSGPASVEIDSRVVVDSVWSLM
jgi:hypothetical protein